MKWFRYILKAIALAFILFSVACEDKFDNQSDSRITESNVSESVVLAEQALKGIYASLSTDNMYSKKLSYYCSLNSDIECISGGTDNGRRAIARGVATAYNTDANGIIKSIYKTIRECNNLINSLDKSASNFKGREYEEMLAIKAEAIVLRAFVYHDLVRVLGNVPYITHNDITDESYYTKKTHRKDILTAEIMNVEDFVEYLPAERETYERINKFSAYAILSEICMTRASRMMVAETDCNLEVVDKIDYMKKAMYYLQEIVNSQLYSLEDNYETIFRKLMSYDSNSAEIIFALPMTRGSSGELGYFVSSKHDEGSKYGSTECGVLVPPTAYYDYDRKDLRRDVSICLHKYTSSSQQSLAGINNMSVGKFRREWLNPIYEGKQKYTGVDLPVIRYSDVLLMLAECVLEVENDEKLAIEFVKEVRQRAFKSIDAQKSVVDYLGKYNTHEQIERLILDERKYEFLGERKRKFDLMRHGILDSMIRRSQQRIAMLKEREEEYNNIPEKIYWRLAYDNETASYATTDDTEFEPDFDFTSEGLKNSKWASAISQSFIDRMVESKASIGYFLPYPSEE